MAVGENVVALSPLDNLMVPCWVKFLYYFSTPENANVQETYEILRKALNLAVAEMPVCGGVVTLRPQERLGWKPNQLEVRIPKDVGRDGKFPLDFKDLTDKLSYGDIKASGFDADQIDTRLLLSKSFNIDLAGGIEATAAQANFVKGGVLLGLAMWHNVVDAHGTYNFAKLWASYAKKLQTEASFESQLSEDVVAANNDREVLTKLWRKEGSTEATTDRQWRILGIYPPHAKDAPKLNEILATAMASNKEMKKVQTGIFTITEEALEQLTRDVTAGDGKLTSDDALHALLWRCIMKARYPIVTDEPSDYQIALDGREKLGEEFDSYLGDTFFFATTTLPLAEVLAPTTTLTKLARTVREQLDSLSRDDLLAAFGSAHNLPGYANLPYSLAGIVGASMIVVTHQYINLPTLDFGPALGSPACERPPGDEWNELFRRTIIMPTASGKGVEVLAALFDDEMDRLKADEEFGKYAKVSAC
ncbi:hypothetical protein M426DRAFT_321122 [Hypoxylon sp. CI-4A]|nr:hypothetical protein M426DRAFT_321122 [Hypoxylon sp. CI-4A]